MRRCLEVVCLVVAAAGLWGCGLFEEPTPENIFLRIDGQQGVPVQIALSKQFVAAVNELGTTRVSIFRADTVARPLPVDTVVNIAIERQFFVELTPLRADSVTVGVRIRADDRLLLDERGLVFRANPWRYVYVFNRPVTRTIEITF